MYCDQKTSTVTIQAETETMARDQAETETTAQDQDRAQAESYVLKLLHHLIKPYGVDQYLKTQELVWTTSEQYGLTANQIIILASLVNYSHFEHNLTRYHKERPTDYLTASPFGWDKLLCTDKKCKGVNHCANNHMRIQHMAVIASGDMGEFASYSDKEIERQGKARCQEAEK
jgi:hypothetical protein